MLWYILLLLLAAEGGLYALASLTADYGRQQAWRHFAAAASGWREVDKVPYADLINASARREGLDARLVAAVIRAESSFQPRAASKAGARGLMQVIPATWREVNGRLRVCDGRHAGECSESCYFDPELNVRIGTAYLGELARRYRGDMVRAVAAYNAGPAAVDRYGGPPPFAETEEYLARVVGYWYAISRIAPPGLGPATGRLEDVKRAAALAVPVTGAVAVLAAVWLRRRHRSWRWR